MIKVNMPWKLYDKKEDLSAFCAQNTILVHMVEAFTGKLKWARKKDVWVIRGSTTMPHSQLLSIVGSRGDMDRDIWRGEKSCDRELDASANWVFGGTEVKWEMENWRCQCGCRTPSSAVTQSRGSWTVHHWIGMTPSKTLQWITQDLMIHKRYVELVESLHQSLPHRRIKQRVTQATAQSKKKWVVYY